MTHNVPSVTNKHPKWSNVILYKICQQFHQLSLLQNEEDNKSSTSRTSSIDELGEGSRIVDILQDSNELDEMDS